jgi:hypothetical protein
VNHGGRSFGWLAGRPRKIRADLRLEGAARRATSGMIGAAGVGVNGASGAPRWSMDAAVLPGGCDGTSLNAVVPDRG